MKVRTLLLAAVTLLAMSAAAFAQVGQFAVSSEPVTAVIKTGITEKAGDIILSWTNPGGVGAPLTVQGTITINYTNVPITVDPVDANIIGTGGFDGGAAAVNTTATDPAAGILVIDIPAGAAVGDTIRITGIRLNIGESGVSGTLQAQISGVGNTIQSAGNHPDVIMGAKDGIVVEGEKVTVNAIAPADGVADIYVTEGFLNAFGQVDGNFAPGRLGIVIEVDQIPPGMTLHFEPQVNIDPAGTFDATDADGNVLGAPVDLTADSEDLKVYYMLTTNSNPSVLEALDIPVEVMVEGSTYVGALPVNANVSLYVNVANGTLLKTKVPRYLTQNTLVPLVDFSGSNTLICVPFAQVQPDISYDTGLGIANTTLDPGPFATPQHGTITFSFYPNEGAPFEYTTKAGSPGAGLDAAGKVRAGRTYSVLVSQLMDAARADDPDVPTSFSGYIFALTNFTCAHGIYTVSNFSTFSQGGQLLVTRRNGNLAEEWNN